MKSLLVVMALGAGLSSGVLFAFSTFVMSGLARIQPPAAIQAMQSINITVINPAFMSVYLGTGLLAIVAVALALRSTSGVEQVYVIAGAAIYLVGVLGITFAFNVPLNNALASVDPTSAEGGRLWSSYLTTWTLWNHLRTLAGAIASLLFILARGS